MYADTQAFLNLCASLQTANSTYFQFFAVNAQMRNLDLAKTNASLPSVMNKCK